MSDDKGERRALKLYWEVILIDPETGRADRTLHEFPSYDKVVAFVGEHPRWHALAIELKTGADGPSITRFESLSRQDRDG